MTCIGGTSTQYRFADFVLILPTLDMDWKDINTKPFRRFPANKKTSYHALVELNKKPYKRFSSKKHFLTCIGGTLTQYRFDDFLQIIILMDMHWWN